MNLESLAVWHSYRSLGLYLESTRNMTVVPIDLFAVNVRMSTEKTGGHDRTHAITTEIHGYS